GLTAYGRESGDWGVHDIGHTLSVLFDTPHGASLSVAYPAWLKLQKDKMPDRITQLGRAVFGTENPDKTIAALEGFFISIGSPVNLSKAGIDADKKPLIIETMIKNKVRGANFRISDEEKAQIVELMDQV
ncbi:MAG: iron-containing alcohol dehydrogenase, partial [Bacteroidales bacterium]|nr:iron-containing alcohol dehydrogenase [Bacteroidales bacterium]